MNIIEELKKNKRQLILMNSELQHAMLSMHPKEFICLQDTSGLNDLQWKATDSDQWYVSENLYNTFRLRDTYKEPEPEIEECEVTISQKTGNLTFKFAGNEYNLHQALSFPSRAGTKFKPAFGEEIYTELWLDLDVEHNGNYKMTHASHVLFRRPK